MAYKRGAIYICDLNNHNNKTIGSEESGIRPVLILQNKKVSNCCDSIMVACITSRSNSKTKIPTHYTLSEGGFLKKRSIVMLEQLKTVSKQQLLKKIGALNTRQMEHIDEMLLTSLGIKKNLSEGLRKYS